MPGWLDSPWKLCFPLLKASQKLQKVLPSLFLGREAALPLLPPRSQAKRSSEWASCSWESSCWHSHSQAHEGLPACLGHPCPCNGPTSPSHHDVVCSEAAAAPSSPGRNWTAGRGGLALSAVLLPCSSTGCHLALAKGGEQWPQRVILPVGGAKGQEAPHLPAVRWTPCPPLWSSPWPGMGLGKVETQSEEIRALVGSGWAPRREASFQSL